MSKEDDLIKILTRTDVNIVFSNFPPVGPEDIIQELHLGKGMFFRYTPDWESYVKSHGWELKEFALHCYKIGLYRKNSSYVCPQI